jgi:TorA maturation chaperone TorD
VEGKPVNENKFERSMVIRMNEQGGKLQEAYIPKRKAMSVEKAGSLAYQEARARANIYRFFSATFLNPPQQDFLDQIAKKDFLGELSSLFWEKGGTELKEFAATACFNKNSETLKQEYMDLFSVPTGRYVTPFEDVYRGMAVDGKQERGPLLGKRAIAVIRIYREAGAEMDVECKELPTHIGVELSFMSFLCEREAWTIRMEENGSLFDQEKTKMKGSNRYRQLQLKFLQAHLNQWFPQLNQSIQANAKNPFYRCLALITESFLNQDTASLSGKFDSQRSNIRGMIGSLSEEYV